jgi:hypothetical protein
MLRVDEERMAQQGVAAAVVDQYIKELRISVNDVYLIWANDYRYASEKRLRSHLLEKKIVLKAKGELLKAIALRMLTAAEKFITRGVLLWDFSIK